MIARRHRPSKEEHRAPGTSSSNLGFAVVGWGWINQLDVLHSRLPRDPLQGRGLSLSLSYGAGLQLTYQQGRFVFFYLKSLDGIGVCTKEQEKLPFVKSRGACKN